MTMIGRKLMTGPVESIPKGAAKSPSWKTRTTVPKEANTDSRKPPVALIGTATDRKTIMSRMIESPTTKMPKGSRALPSWSETSI